MGPGNGPDPLGFLGVGWAFPVGVGAGGGIALARHGEDVAQAIRIVLGTAPGERVMRPDFGAGLVDLVFAPLDVAAAARIEARVREALVRWEPRIDVLDVGVAPVGADRSTARIELTYRVRAANTRDNLVYDLYLREGTPS